jgi:hypothetical protein
VGFERLSFNKPKHLFDHSPDILLEKILRIFQKPLIQKSASDFSKEITGEMFYH